MQGPHLPPPFDDIGQRPFSFYPSIANAEPNDWFIRSANWSDVQVVNSRTKQNIWIPRQYIGSISETDDPVLIVGLTKELEFREGVVWPRVKRVIEMPLAVNDAFPRLWLRDRQQKRGAPAPVVGIRLEVEGLSKKGRVAAYLGVSAALVSLLAVVLCRDWVFSNHFAHPPVAEEATKLTGSDDYASVVQHMGYPASDTWRSNGSVHIRALTYPRRAVTVILVGPDRNHVHFAGIIDLHHTARHPARSAPEPGNAAALANVPRF